MRNTALLGFLCAGSAGPNFYTVHERLDDRWQVSSRTGHENLKQFTYSPSIVIFVDPKTRNFNTGTAQQHLSDFSSTTHDFIIGATYLDIFGNNFGELESIEPAHTLKKFESGKSPVVVVRDKTTQQEVGLFKASLSPKTGAIPIEKTWDEFGEKTSVRPAINKVFTDPYLLQVERFALGLA